MDNGAIIYLGHFLTDELSVRRALPTKNSAASNRMWSIARALVRAGAKLVIVGGGTTLRIKFAGARFFRAERIRRDEIEIRFGSTFGLPLWSAIWEPIATIMELIAAARNGNVRYVIGYNYYPSTLLTALVGKYCFGCKIVFQVEDVCKVSAADWVGQGDRRPLLQLIGSGLLCWACSESDAIIVPARSFLKCFQPSCPVEVIGGCVAEAGGSETQIRAPGASPRLLVSGALDAEHGIDVILGGLDSLRKTPGLIDRLVIDVCGYGLSTVRESFVRGLQRDGVALTFHGNLSADEYQRLLRLATITVAFQDPTGRHARTKTPSKAYEQMALGKVVLVNRVGNLAELPDDAVIFTEYSAAGFHRTVEQLLARWPASAGVGERAKQFASSNFDEREVARRIMAFLASLRYSTI